MKELRDLKKGLVFVVSAPAGAGKTTLVGMLKKEFSHVVVSVSFTTRQPRQNEVQGIHYNFISKVEFEQKMAAGDFLEYAEIYGEYYGTSLRWLEEQQSLGKHVVLVIDTQGAAQLKKKLIATYVFIMPPSLEALKLRLTHRQTETKELIEKRLKWAEEEIKRVSSYDYQVINDDLMIAYEALRSIVIAEEHKIVNLVN